MRFPKRTPRMDVIQVPSSFWVNEASLLRPFPATTSILSNKKQLTRMHRPFQNGAPGFPGVFLLSPSRASILGSTQHSLPSDDLHRLERADGSTYEGVRKVMCDMERIPNATSLGRAMV